MRLIQFYTGYTVYATLFIRNLHIPSSESVQFNYQCVLNTADVKTKQVHLVSLDEMCFPKRNWLRLAALRWHWITKEMHISINTRLTVMAVKGPGAQESGSSQFFGIELPVSTNLKKERKASGVFCCLAVLLRSNHRIKSFEVVPPSPWAHHVELP